MSVAERREREREARRDHILDAAKRVFYAKGVDAVKMKDVAVEAQLGKGTLYLYFRTKEELILGVAVRHQKKLIARFSKLEAEAESGLSLLRSLILAYAEHMRTPREHLCMAMTRWASGAPLPIDSRGGEQMRENLRRLLGTLHRAIDDGKADGTISPHVDTKQASMSLMAAANGALLMQLKLACVDHESLLAFTPPTFEESMDLFLRALRPGAHGSADAHASAPAALAAVGAE